MRFDIVVFDGLDELDVIGPLEVLRRARRSGAAVDARLVTNVPRSRVVGAYGLTFVPDAVHSPGADVIIVPGGGWITRSPTGAWGEARRGDWLPLLRRAADSGALMSSVCTGAMLLAHARVIGARRATTHHNAWSDLEATGATLVKERVVDDGDLVTGGGVTSGIDLTLWLVERLISREVADEIAQDLEHTRSRPTCV